MIARLRVSSAAVAVLLQVLGMVVASVGAGLVAGVGVGLLVGGVLSIVAGVALEKEAAHAGKPSS